MTAYTSTQAGPWNVAATWGGGGYPVDGDTASIGHAVSLTAPATIGTGVGGSTAITITAGGTLTIVSFKLTCNGGIAPQASNRRQIILGAAGSIEFGNAGYTFDLPSQYDGRTPILYALGTSGARCSISTVAGGTPAYFTGSVNYYGEMDCEYCDFTRIGSAANPFCSTMLNGGSSTEYAVFRLVNCRFNACGAIDFLSTNIGAYAQLTISDCNFSNSAGAYCIDRLSCYNGKNAAGIRLLTNNVFDKHCILYAPNALTITGSYFHEGWTNSSSDSAAGMIMGTNFVRLSGSYNTIRPDAQQVVDAYFYGDSGGGTWTNPHFIEMGSFASLSPNHAAQRNVFEYDFSDDNGDCIMGYAPAVALSLYIKDNLFIPNPAGNAPGSPLSMLGGANSSVNFLHNTYVTSTNAGLAVGETYAGHAGMLNSFKSNLVFGGATQGYLVHDSGVNDSVSNLLAAAAADKNARYNTLAGSNGNGYHNLEISTGTLGATDIAADPMFFDATRNLAKWDLSLGGPGTAAHAIAELMKRNLADYNSAYNIAALLAYVKAGFRVTNPLLKDAGHDGATIGAMGYVAAAVATTARRFARSIRRRIQL